jgi:transposase-like protein
MNCPHCNGTGHKHSTNRNGTTRYRCADCKRTYSESTGRPAGRPTTNTPTDSAVRMRRMRIKRP